MRVDELVYRADPLKYANYDASMTLVASNARLAVMPAQKGKLSLALYDCRQGRARISVGVEDLERGLTAAARVRKVAGLKINQIDLRLKSISAHNLEAEVTVHANLLLVPTSFKLLGRADVDDDFNIHFTSLTAQGNDPTGAIIASVLQGKLDKLNNKAAPLLRLPGDKIKVTDLRITLDQRLTVELAFAGTQ
jgi:hypothetical protein